MVVRKEAFEAIGGFNEEFAVAFNDVDFCIRLRAAGWRIIWSPAVELYHHESVSVGHTAACHYVHEVPENVGLSAVGGS